MYVCDYHIHSDISFDGKDSILALARAAASAGLSEICVTDHCDIDTASSGALAYDCGKYMQELEKARSEAGGAVRLRAGVELGQPLWDAALAGRILSREFDFVIGSIHADGAGEDYYFKKYGGREECLGLIGEYLADVKAMCLWGGFSVLGHLTYPLRYMRGREGFDVDFLPFQEEIREIFGIIIDSGMGIEVNCSGLFSNIGETLPPLSLLSLYRECGGCVITIGSDSHSARHVGRGIKEGRELLKTAGFRYFSVFEKMKPSMIGLD